jgi:hypothetical protein
MEVLELVRAKAKETLMSRTMPLAMKRRTVVDHNYPSLANNSNNLKEQALEGYMLLATILRTVVGHNSLKEQALEGYILPRPHLNEQTLEGYSLLQPHHPHQVSHNSRSHSNRHLSQYSDRV